MTTVIEDGNRTNIYAIEPPIEIMEVAKVNEKDLQDQQCEYSPQALPEPTSTISCLHDRFLDGQLLPTPHLYFLYLSFSDFHDESRKISFAKQLKS